jgi:hypothetical protein
MVVGDDDSVAFPHAPILTTRAAFRPGAQISRAVSARSGPRSPLH